MKKILGTGVALALMAGTTFAADMPMKPYYKAPAKAPLWDVAVGGWVASDYNFRGVSQSDRHASGGAYFELQYTSGIGQIYVGTAANAIELNTGTEMNFYAGVRNTWGKFGLDVGYLYYWYPKENPALDTDFFEIYAKGSYAVTSDFTLGLSVFYTPDLLHLGGSNGIGDIDGIYVEASAKYVLPWTTSTAHGPLGAFVSGAVGHWDIGIDNTGVVFGGADMSYTYWNAGVAFTLSALTLDLRYHDTDLSPAECVTFTGFAQGGRWCSSTFIAKLSFDTLLSKIKN